MTSASMSRILCSGIHHRQYVERGDADAEDERNFEQQVQSDGEPITSPDRTRRWRLRTAARASWHRPRVVIATRLCQVAAGDNAELRAK